MGAVDVNKVRAWINQLASANPSYLNLPVLSCCGRSWTPMQILQAVESNAPETPQLLAQLATNDPSDNELAKEALLKWLQEHPLPPGYGLAAISATGTQVYGQQELMQAIQTGTGIGKQLIEAAKQALAKLRQV